MPTCATYRPLQLLTTFQSGSVGVYSENRGRTYEYNYSTKQIAYIQCYSTSNYTAPQKLGWMSTSNQLRTGSPMAEMELHHSADAHLLAAHRPSGSAVRYALYAGGQRAMAEHVEHGQVTLIRHHVGDAEVDIDPRTARRTYRLRVQAPTGVAAVLESDSSAKGITASYVHTDFQGSWVLLTNAAGQAVAHQAFDAWGRPRNPLNWAPLPEGQGISMPGQRGYTGHEHLPSLGLIHMNGRAYAPGLQHFLSPDPVLQASANAQSHNRYAYCLNNPLRYTDPSGYIHALAVPYDNDREIIEDSGWSGGWASALGRGTPLAWTTRIPSIGGYGGSIIVTRVADAGHGAYRVSSTGSYQTVDIFGAHGGYTRYVSPWLGASGPTATHFFYDLSLSTSANSWGYSPSLNDCMGGSVAGGGGGWSRGGYGGGGYGGGGSGGGGAKKLTSGTTFAKELENHYVNGNGRDYHLNKQRLYDIFNQAIVNDAILWDNKRLKEDNIYTIPVDLYKTEYAYAFGRASMEININFNGIIYPVGFFDLWDLDPKPWGIRSYSAEIITRYYNWRLRDGKPFKIVYP